MKIMLTLAEAKAYKERKDFFEDAVIAVEENLFNIFAQKKRKS